MRGCRLVAAWRDVGNWESSYSAHRQRLRSFLHDSRDKQTGVPRGQGFPNNPQRVARRDRELVGRQQPWVAKMHFDHSRTRLHGRPCAKWRRFRIGGIGNNRSDDVALPLDVILARARCRRSRRLLPARPAAQRYRRSGKYPQLPATHGFPFPRKLDPHGTNLTPLFQIYEPCPPTNVALPENFPILSSEDFSLTQLPLPKIIICTSILWRFDKLNSARCGGERPGWRQNISL